MYDGECLWIRRATRASTLERSIVQIGYLKRPVVPSYRTRKTQIDHLWLGAAPCVLQSLRVCVFSSFRNNAQDLSLASDTGRCQSVLEGDVSFISNCEHMVGLHGSWTKVFSRRVMGSPLRTLVARFQNATGAVALRISSKARRAAACRRTRSVVEDERTPLSIEKEIRNGTW